MARLRLGTASAGGRVQWAAALSLMGGVTGGLFAQGAGLPDAAALRVKPGHPILFVDAEVVGEIRSRTDDCRRFADMVERYRKRKTDDPSNVTEIRAEVAPFADWTHPGEYLKTSMWFGADAYINEDELSVAYARQYLLALLDQGIDDARSQECHALGTAFALGALYDWLYDHLDDDLRHRTRLGVLTTVGELDTRWRFFREGGDVGGHATCWANPYALVGLLAIRTDIEQESAEVRARYFELLGKVVHNIRDEIAPIHAWICRDGGHHMGWDYGTCYTQMLPYIVWDFATDEKSLFGDWQEQHVYWYLYGLRHDVAPPDEQGRDRRQLAYGYYPQSGDCYGTQIGSPTAFNILAPALHHDNPHAKWFYNHFVRRPTGDIDWISLLYANFGPDAGEPPDELPLSRLFANAGFAIMRDSWDLDRNALVVFKSAPFFSHNHHHKDQNSFTVYYQAPLAIDSGGYNLCGQYGSRHWYSYYTRSIAHNTILVHDPDESFGSSNRWGDNSNDGGQAFRPEAGRLEDLLPGGQCALDGILRYEDGPGYTYAMGDATKAYSPHKLELFERHVVYLRAHSYDHPAVVIYDHVVARDASFKKTYLLHSIGEPVIEGRVFRVEGDDGLNTERRGRLYDEVILPEDAEIRAVGGVANEREFYVADDGTGNPRNYREEFAEAHSEAAAQEPIDRERGAFRELGGWRVEVSPTAERLEDRFLNVLSITDGEDDHREVQAQYVSSGSFDGVAIRDNDGRESTLVLLRRRGEPLTEDAIPTINCRKLLIAGLRAGEELAIALGPGSVRITAAAPGPAEGTRASPEGTIYTDLDP